MDLTNKTLTEIRDEIASGKTTSLEVTKAVLADIEAENEKTGAYLEVFADHCLEKAAKIDQRIKAGEKCGALAGVPIAIKDNMTTLWGKTTCSSKILENFEAPYNATVVEKLLAEDAIIIGKVNLDEFAMGSSTENAGLGKTTNPWDSSRVPGGSSGGSAAAVSAGLCFGALGSDTGGSIRQPASFCGVVGVKPTYGRVSRYGLVAFGSSLDQIGPLARNTQDAALLMNIISGHDPKDSTSLSEEAAPNTDFTLYIDKPLEGLKIAVVPEFIDKASDSVSKAVQQAIDFYSSKGAEIREVKMPHSDYAVATYYIVATAEASANLARFDGVRYGYRSEKAENYLDVYTKSRDEGFGAEVKRRIMLGTYALSSGYYDAYYLKALKVRNLIRQDFKEIFKDCDCLLTPTSPSGAFKFGEKSDDPIQMYLEDIYTISANLAGVPGVSVPCGFDENNMPVGMQIITDTFQEAKMFQIARMFEKEHPYQNQIARKGKA
ncbi:Asp-tRNA(Asn)/Glu-tRNA(Gln) amidotransferase subunit GatA [Sedimentisphaera salicampi]|uniref:Glutamyl-tRNA(Gln) amidotransferase subunit A n=1 Tax=Sedimentisphaera salicampi TaxID=1941349 RepID=A0A1W6LNB5_9BACT|nr:Asp-tRNA(Asn)/Glu-tRNA(Gln) amidotransferase subunit GatA [Sedimentisphaera salicampi]ARN57233.1 Glutamyl-tRNA(Gln) amidotransferase subunit A [Sedimentisphaera salicampi]OXU14674.1 Glutamyl-tRNA(Gln) amidotransferase subunit A [Sedimentisphaera salicampi]